MKIDKKNRRMFLQGVGGTLLSIPFLESILTDRAFAQAQSSAKFFVANVRGHHCYSTLRFKDILPLANISGTNYRSADLPSDLSMIGNTFSDPMFNSVRNDMTILQGLDYGPLIAGHSKVFPLTGKMNTNNTGTPLPSIDQIMARSGNLTANKPYTSVLLDSAVGNSGRISVDAIELQPINGGFYHTRHAFDTLFNGIASQNSNEPSLADVNHLKFIDRVKSDLDELMRNQRLSASDKERLLGHIELINTLENRLSGSISVPATCNVPSRPSGSPILATRHQEVVDLIFASINCNISSIFTILSNQGEDFDYYSTPGTVLTNLPSATEFASTNFHGGSTSLIHHGDGAFDLSRNGYKGINHLRTLMEFDLKCLGPAAKLAERLKSATTSEGRNLLDDTVIVSLSEHGTVTPTINDVHIHRDIQAVIFGNSPRFKTGKVFDFLNKNSPVNDQNAFPRNKPGRLYNHFLNSILSAMGVDRSLWQNGVGEFNGIDSHYSSANRSQIISEIFR